MTLFILEARERVLEAINSPGLVKTTEVKVVCFSLPWKPGY